MAEKPSYLLCFLGRVILMTVMCCWLVLVLGIAFHPGTYVGAYIGIFIQAASHRDLQKERWKARHKTPQSQRTQYWLTWIGSSLVLLLLSEIWMYFYPPEVPELVVFYMTLFPLGLSIDFLLTHLGIELPLRKWRERQQIALSLNQSLPTVATAASSAPIVQQIGRP